MIMEGLVQLPLYTVYQPDVAQLISFTLSSPYLPINLERLLVIIEGLIQLPLYTVYIPDVAQLASLPRFSPYLPIYIERLLVVVECLVQLPLILIYKTYCCLRHWLLPIYGLFPFLS